jgi:uncharacterized membrane protein YphA (DoxX/SURF4 family)
MNSKLTLVFRLLLAIVLLVFGSNKFFPFLSMPALEGEAASFMGFLAGTGYFFTLIGFIEVLTGLLLLINKWKGFALILFAPVSVHILLYHFNFDLGGLPLGGAVFALNALLIFTYWKNYKPTV